MSWSWIEQLLQDAGHALRLFRRAPGFAAIVVLILTLGIAANTAVFTLVDAVLLQPLPFQSSERLVVVWGREIYAKGTSKLFDSYSDYQDWKRVAHSFEAVAAVSWAPEAAPSRILSGLGRTRNVFVLPVTADFFSLLGVTARLGRTFNDSDSGRGCLVVLADGFWQSSFGGDKSALGRSIRLGDQSCTVLGVMPASFAFLPPGAPVAMWTMMAEPAGRDNFAVGFFGRLRPGVTLASAQAEVSSLHHRLHAHDRTGATLKPVVYPLHDEFTWLTGRNLKLSLLVIFAAVGFVLLICCVNVANLLLGRAIERQRELAVRMALGSGRARILRQLLTESLLLSLVASGAGAGLAAAALHYFRMTRPIEMPPGTNLDWNLPVLLFTVLLSVLTTVFFGFAPAWRGSGADLQEVLKSGGRTASPGSRQQRLAKLLVVAEVTLTVVLLAAAGLLIQTANQFASAPLGFEPNGLFYTAISLPQTGYEPAERQLQLYQRLEAQLRRASSVTGIALSSSRPVDGGGAINILEVKGHAPPRVGDSLDTFEQTISQDYFSVMKTRLLKGRFFATQDEQRSEEVAIVNNALVREYFGQQDPIGMHIRPFRDGKNTQPWLRVVGVVENQKRTTVYQEMAWAEQPVVYRPLTQNPQRSANILLRVTGSPAAEFGERIQRQIAALDPELPIEEVQPVNDLEAKATAYPQFRARLFGAFAALALILAAVGLFGVLSQLVAQRTQEIGVRVALGAQRATILLMILRQGLFLTGAGMALGVASAWALGHYLSALLYGVKAGDPLLLIALAATLLLIALIAIYIPARRAAQVDPVVALRNE